MICVEGENDGVRGVFAKEEKGVYASFMGGGVGPKVRKECGGFDVDETVRGDEEVVAGLVGGLCEAVGDAGANGCQSFAWFRAVEEVEGAEGTGVQRAGIGSVFV